MSSVETIFPSSFAGEVEVRDHQVRVRMPSNIALIKYMGRASHHDRIPLNPSLSITLPYLLSAIECSAHYQSKDLLVPLHEGSFQLDLSEQGKARFLRFWQQLKERFGIEGYYRIQSGNNFPSDCGIASSSSSFAALTVAAYLVAKWVEKRSIDLSLEQLANMARMGSGASARSFFRGAVLWEGDQVKPVELPHLALGIHAIIVVSDAKKKVSSSEAHERVATSLLLERRKQRAMARLNGLLRPDVQWSEVFTIVWNEFWDMMALFETSQPPFGYLEPESLDVLHFLRDCWQQRGDGPLVTMDAGPNIHVLFRHDQDTLAKELLQRIQAQWQNKIWTGYL